MANSDVQKALAGRVSYDELVAADQEIVRAEWAVRIAASRKALDFSAEFGAAGITGWIEADGRESTTADG